MCFGFMFKGFRVWGLVFQGLGIRVWKKRAEFGFEAYALRFRFKGSGFGA